jgi:hypothetical protein
MAESKKDLEKSAIESEVLGSECGREAWSNRVVVDDTLGAVVVSIVAIFLLITIRQLLERNRELTEQLLQRSRQAG